MCGALFLQGFSEYLQFRVLTFLNNLITATRAGVVNSGLHYNYHSLRLLTVATVLVQRSMLQVKMLSWCK